VNQPPGDPTGLSVTDELAAEVLVPSGLAMDWQGIESRLNGTEIGIPELRHLLAAGREALKKRFLANSATGELVTDFTQLVDLIILSAWNHSTAALDGVALIAVGGFGRGELHPYSDIDLLILLPKLTRETKKTAGDQVAAFLTMLWDIGLEVGHSTRTVRECKDQSKGDITIATTLMESRLLCGPAALYDEMRDATGPENIWPSKVFFEAKLKEQQARHLRYNDTAYNLEPNVKGSPGGLRDIQMVLWVTRRHFNTGSLGDLVGHGFLTSGQLHLLREGREFLWRIRFALHTLTGRREDRLLFDYQAKIAEIFGYQDASYMLAVEQLMQRYYRTVMELSRLNEMLLQLYQEAILLNPNVQAERINERFGSKNGFLQTIDDEVFERNPSALLELFLLLQQYPELKGVSARTIGLIKRSLRLIDDEFRQNPRNHQLFLQILRAPEGVTHGLRRMNLYGVLASYIPAFGRIVGRMQYDLFHAYTIDAHTLFVVSNLRRFALTRFDHEFPRCSEIMQALPVPEVAYIAGLFHDIAKGRGGDHSRLGAVDAESFCLEHGMTRYESRLVAWLVRQHLVLSLTAQKKDINDPEVIRKFAETVGDQVHLDYLFVLTVADVRATNPSLWNSWKSQLFTELYLLARQALRRGLENPIDREELQEEHKTNARKLLSGSGIESTLIDTVWSELGSEYFLRCKAEEIAWHTRLLSNANTLNEQIHVDIHDEPGAAGSGVFIYTPQETYTFATATGIFDELGLTIADARVLSLANGYSISTYVVLEQTGERIQEDRRREKIRNRLIQAISSTSNPATNVKRRTPRQVRIFSTPTLVTFSANTIEKFTVMELIASDRPGLLSDTGKILQEHQISIHSAKIATVGERTEDIFHITDSAGQPLDEESCELLKKALTDGLQSL